MARTMPVEVDTIGWAATEQWWTSRGELHKMAHRKHAVYRSQYAGTRYMHMSGTGMQADGFEPR